MSSTRAKIYVYVTVASLLAWLFVGWAKGRTWEALIPDLPAKVSTEDAAINGSYYVLRQTHEPLFRIDNGDDFSSRILKTWKRDINYKSYTFCPNTELTFTPGKEFSAKFFEEYISGVTKDFDTSAAIRATGGCVEVTFQKPRKSYLYYLTDYRQAPTIRSEKPFELGLGPFYVDKMTLDSIRLARKNPVRRGYNFITLHHYLGQSDTQLENRGISDFNKISSVEIPEWVKTEQIGFDDVVINTVTMVINHPDRKVREAVYNCIDVRGLREAFIKQRKDFLDIGSVIPIGVFGARPGLPDQACRALTKSNTQLIFANLRTGNEAELEKFFTGFTRRTGVRVKVVNFAVPELLKMIKRTPKGYNLFIMSKDAVRSEVEPFLRYFYLLDYKLPEISIKYSKLTHEDDPEKKKRLGAEIADDLAGESVVLPLYQNVREYHYPRGIKNLTVGRGFFEFPEVADFRW